MAGFDFQELISAFIVLFAVLDIIGAIPIILDLKQKGRSVNALKATLIALALLLGFFFAGDMMLKLFQVDIASFAIAGSVVLFLMALEMILDIEIFKNTGISRKPHWCLWSSRCWRVPVRLLLCCRCVQSMHPLISF